MSLLYLLDTNVVSRLARAQPPAELLLSLSQHEQRCAISSITVEELHYGALVAPVERRAGLTSSEPGDSVIPRSAL